MTTTEWTMITLLVLVVMMAVTTLGLLPQINAWEKANDYPYGKLCDLYRNCK